MQKLSLVALALMLTFVLSLWPSTELMPDRASGANALADEAAPLYTPVPTPLPTPTPTPVPTPSPTPSPTPIANGSEGPEVKALQEMLAMQGFLDGAPDGRYGPGTQQAVDAARAVLGMPSGPAEWALLQALSRELPFDAAVPEQIMRVQRRLGSLGFLYKGVDGALGNASGEALRKFQKQCNLIESGYPDPDTLRLLFSDSAPASARPYHEYKVVVDISAQRVYVYAWKNGEYKTRVRTMKCSTGTGNTPTPTGTFQETVRRGEKWHHFGEYGVWAQYAIHIDPTGNIMFHSVLYNRRGGSPTSGSVGSLGSRASHGCIRLSVKDAKWLYEHSPDGTTVVIKK